MIEHETTTARTQRRRRAQGMVEYILIIGLIAVLMVAGVVNFKDSVDEALRRGEKMLKANVTERM